jgi:hypothetical protein
MKDGYFPIADDLTTSLVIDPYVKTVGFAAEPNPVIVHVEDVKHFILRTEEKDYVLDFQRLLKDYGIKVKE